MVTSISFGNFSNIGGKNVLSGGQSGIDTQGLIKGLTEAKRQPAVVLETNKKTNESVSKALDEFQTLLTNFKRASNFLRNPPGVANAAENAFGFTKVDTISNTSTLAGNYISVNSAPGVSAQTFNISEITSVAKAKQQSSPNITIADANTAFVTATSTANRFTAGALVLNTKTTDVTINLAEGDTLNQVATKFNNVTDKTGIIASVIKVSDGNFRLVFTATSTGTLSSFDFNTDGAATTGTVDGSEAVFNGLVFNDDQNAANAEFVVNNIPIVRQGNSVSDVVSGVTFTLFQPTPVGTELKSTVSADSDNAVSGIIAFVNAYNEIRQFAAKQLELGDDGKYVETAVLARNGTFRNTISNIAANLSQVISGITGTQVVDGKTVNDPNRISELGLTFDDLPQTEDAPLIRNILNVDETKLKAALNNDFDAVRKVFEFSFASTNPNVRVFSRTNALAVNAFSVTITPAAPAVAKQQSTANITIADAVEPFVTATPTAGRFTAGNLVINGANGDVAITLDEDDSLAQVAAKFNAVSADTKISASVQTVSTGVFKLVFTSTVPGLAGDFNLNTDGGTAAGTVDGSEAVLNGFVFENVRNAANAVSTTTATATYNNGTTPVTIDVDAVAIRDSSTGATTGFTIKGKTGTVLSGLQLIYAGTTTSTFAVQTSQGVGDKLYNLVSDVLDETNGPLKSDLDAIATSDKRLADEIAKIDESIERFRQQLLERFAALETAISRVNSLLQTIDANTNAQNNQ